jgi:hypothetical protein
MNSVLGWPSEVSVQRCSTSGSLWPSQARVFFALDLHATLVAHRAAFYDDGTSAHVRGWAIQLTEMKVI